MQEKENVLRIFQESEKAFREGDSSLLRNLSNQTNNTASRTQDPDNIAVAVIIYSLSKIIERGDYKKYSNSERFSKNVLLYLKKSIQLIKSNKDEELKNTLTHLRREINNLSGKMKKYIQEVFRKAEINKASKIYEHGISMETTAKLLGITMFELANYVGNKVDFNEVRGNKLMTARQRVKTAMEMFG